MLTPVTDRTEAGYAIAETKFNEFTPVTDRKEAGYATAETRFSEFATTNNHEEDLTRKQAVIESDTRKQRVIESDDLIGEKTESVHRECLLLLPVAQALWEINTLDDIEDRTWSTTTLAVGRGGEISTLNWDNWDTADEGFATPNA
jgi:hypothetical protein